MKFTHSHEWISVENGVGTVGISSHAQKELGEVVYIELPTIGKQVYAGEDAAVLESTKAAADIYSPASGEIIAINNDLKTQISAINHSPEKEGWLFKIKLKNPKELEDLLDLNAYLDLVKS